jgi:phospholipase A1
MSKSIVMLVGALAALFPIVGISAVTMDECLLAGIETAEEDATISSLRRRCAAEVSVSEAPLPEAEEKARTIEYIRSSTDASERDKLIGVHNQNYVLPFTYNSDVNRDPWIGLASPETVAAISEEEAVFQVSAKLAVWRNMFSPNMDLLFGYTQKSWWQIYTNEAEISQTFRETNYQPDLFARYYGGPGRVSAIDFGYVHESNGRGNAGGSGTLNRAWDRLMARATFDWEEVQILLRGWYAFTESDDNPNMEDYLGYGDIRVQWAPNSHTFGLMFRPGKEEIGAEASWSWQMTDSLRLYTQYYYGYGESLLDYNAKTSRIGIGIMFNDFLMNR